MSFVEHQEDVFPSGPRPRARRRQIALMGEVEEVGDTEIILHTLLTGEHRWRLVLQAKRRDDQVFEEEEEDGDPFA